MSRNAVATAYRQIVKAGLLEDRLEYSVDMLARMYSLTQEQAVTLRELLHVEAAISNTQH